ncbi:MAG TPA: IS982 family transposase [Blastocatellia bacterium]|nr:IS982 family transposase [Blastocatellia bacterium]
MERDLFIITVYCLVVQHYRALIIARPLRRGGFAPQLSDEEVITMEICGECWKLHTEEDLYDYFRAHYQHFFPKLKDRPAFVRQAFNLWAIKAQMQQRLVQVSGQSADPAQPIDTLPLPVCTYTRAPRDRCFPGVADYGHCDAKNLDYYGFKLGLRVSRGGMIVHYALLAARPHDVNHTGVLLEGFHGGLAPADKGFIDEARQQLYRERQGVDIVTAVRKNMTEKRPRPLLKACARWRKIIETVGSHLTERFAIARTRAHDLYHYQHRIIRKVLAHTVTVFLNLQLGREPLDLDGLVTAAS